MPGSNSNIKYYREYFTPQLVPAPIISGLSLALYVGPTNLSAGGMTAGVKFSSIRLLVIACSHLVPIVSGWLGATPK